MTEKKTKFIDRLTEDPALPGQLFVCVSFLSPEGIRNCNIRGLKVRGVFATKEEADDHAKKLQEIDPDFHVFVGEVGKWLAWDPDPNDPNYVKDQDYYEKELQELMKGYKEQLQNSKKMQRQVQEDKLKQVLEQENSKENKIKDRLRKKLREKQKKQQTPTENNVNTNANTNANTNTNTNTQSKNENKSNSMANAVPNARDTSLEEKEKQLKEKELLIGKNNDQLQNEINKKEANVQNIQSQLDKVKELYEKLKKSANRDDTNGKTN